MDTLIPLQWSTEKRKVSDLKSFEKNPRKLSEEQKTQLTASLQKFNLVEIPAIDLDGTLIAGHQRVKILKALGRGDELIDVRVPNRQLTKAEFEEYNLRSNKNTGDWDNAILKMFDKNVLAESGFSDKEVEDLFGVDEVKGEVEFTKELLEENNYLVFVFNNVLDWQVAKDKFGIKAVSGLDSKEGYEKKGVGRVLDGKVLIR